MRLSVLLLLTLILAILAGCAGSGVGGGVAADFYRGTAQSAGSKYLPAGTGTIVFDFPVDTLWQANGEVGGVQFKVGSGPGGDMIGIGVSTFPGDLTITPAGVNYVATFKIDGETIFTATVSPAQLPALGTTTAVPPGGSYEGEYYTTLGGRIRGVGTMTATIGPAGQLAAVTVEGLDLPVGSSFTGTLQTGGAVADAFVSLNGSTLIPDTAPVFSFDGETLIVRYDWLGPETTSQWLVLRRQ